MTQREAKPWGITRQMAGQIYRRARAAQQKKQEVGNDGGE